MKKHKLMLIGMLFLTGTITACEKDVDTKPVETTLETVYQDNTETGDNPTVEPEEITTAANGATAAQNSRESLKSNENTAAREAENDTSQAVDVTDSADVPATEVGNTGEPSQSMEDGGEDYYITATGISTTEVEAFARLVKQQILEKDWNALSENIKYPITIGTVTYHSSGEFAAADFNSISEEFIRELQEESCEQMFHNWQGIMMGSGQVWFAEVLNEDLSSQGLKITALNGLIP